MLYYIYMIIHRFIHWFIYLFVLDCWDNPRNDLFCNLRYQRLGRQDTNASSSDNKEAGTLAPKARTDQMDVGTVVTSDFFMVI